MPKFEDISAFENALKETLQNHGTPVPTKLWSGINAGTAPSAGVLGQTATYFGSVTNLLKVVLFVGGIAAIGIVIFNENKAPKPDSNPELETPSIQATQDTSLDSNKTEIANARNKNAAIVPSKEPKNTIGVNKNESKKVVPLTQQSKYIDNITIPADIVPSSEKTDLRNEKTIEQADDKLETITPTFTVSNLKPCIGETVVASSTSTGNWFVDDKLVASQQKSVSFTANSTKHSVYLQVASTKVSQQVYPQHLTAQILSEHEERNYSFRLDDSRLIANWYLDSKLVMTNEKSIELTIESVGDHTIKAVPLNRACAQAVEHTLEVSPIGSIKISNVFTPDLDGYNDRYKVVIENYENFSIQIYNGTEMVYSSQNPDEGWNGTNQNNGINSPEGEYIAKINYKLQGENPETKNIIITLKR